MINLHLYDSTGNRVLLRALDNLAIKNVGYKIDNAFLFEPAVACTALSPDPSKDETKDGVNHRFIHVMDIVKTMTVFCSLNDPALYRWYWHYQEACIVGAWLDVTYARNPPSLFDPFPVNALTALGLSGPDMKDTIVRGWVESGKIIKADMTKYSTGHSYMKVPGDIQDEKSVMYNAYAQFIMNKNGMGLKKFGLYDPAKFKLITTKKV